MTRDDEAKTPIEQKAHIIIMMVIRRAVPDIDPVTLRSRSMNGKPVRDVIAASMLLISMARSMAITIAKPATPFIAMLVMTERGTVIEGFLTSSDICNY